MRTVNVGVIGVGAMGYNHARVYYKLEEANLVAVSDVSERTLNKVAKKYDAKGFTDYEDLLKDPEIEVVSVCVPTTFHHDVVMEAIKHGKHVLVEKPIAFTLKEAEDMIAAAKEAGVILATGHVERFNPAVQKAKELIDNDVIGDIVSASAKRVGPFPPRIKDVGVTIDLAIHDLDVMNYLFDEDVIQVYGTMNSILEKCEFEDHAEIMINFKNESTGILEVNWLTPYKRRQIEITGTDGIISVDYIEQSIDVYGKFAQDIDIKHEEPLKEELRSFLNAVVNGTEPEITGEDGLKALKMVIAATKSSREHKPISFDEIEYVILMKQKLIKKAQELRQHGFTTGEIADELNVSMDTARWLTLQKPAEEKPEAPVDFFINWKSLGGNSTRLRYVSGALSDMALSHGEAEVILGIAVSGIPFATMMADFLEDMSGVETSLAVYHPHKHRKEKDDGEGAISTNFGSVEGKKVVIVDDVITSGKTVKEVIHAVKDHGGEPIAVTVLIDKSGLSEIEEVPIESLIKVGRL